MFSGYSDFDFPENIQYDTGERIIGEFDGKTLYQDCIYIDFPKDVLINENPTFTIKELPLTFEVIDIYGAISYVNGSLSGWASIPWYFNHTNNQVLPNVVVNPNNGKKYVYLEVHGDIFINNNNKLFLCYKYIKN